MDQHVLQFPDLSYLEYIARWILAERAENMKQVAHTLEEETTELLQIILSFHVTQDVGEVM